MADGINLELAGVPSAVVCTDAFSDTVEALARLRGFPEFRYVAVPHPVADLSETELVQLSGAFVDVIVEILSSPS